jgi:hypothetical protein
MTTEVVTVGIQQTKEVTVFLAKLGVSTAQCIIGKKFEFKYFIDDIEAIPAAIGDITEVPAELKDIDSDEAKELIDAVVAELAPFGIDGKESAKYFIQAGINFIEGAFGVYKGIVAAKEEKKEEVPA